MLPAAHYLAGRHWIFNLSKDSIMANQEWLAHINYFIKVGQSFLIAQ